MKSFFEDQRVLTFPELAAIDELFRRFSDVPQSSPKIWTDCYLAAHAAANRASLITFDQAFARYDIECLILT
jgi:predicted nucleic acid-binding protein